MRMDEKQHLTDVMNRIEGLIELFHDAVMNERIEIALVAMKEAKAGKRVDSAVDEAREAIGQSFAALLAAPMLKIIEDRTRIGELVEQIRDSRDGIDACRSDLSSLKERLASEEVLRVLNPNSRFLNRLETDHLEDKKAIAVEVADRYFSDSEFRCFIQASTLAVEVGKQIAISGSDGILIHTNSVALPITILPSRSSGISVYTNCGSEFDDICGGWLFPLKDTTAHQQLSDLFLRPQAPLETVFISPFMFTLDGRIHYEGKDSSALVKTLIRSAKRIVILLVGDRVNGDIQDLPLRIDSIDISTAAIDKQVEFVIHGNPKNTSQKEAIAKLVERGFRVHWKLPEEEAWATVSIG